MAQECFNFLTGIHRISGQDSGSDKAIMKTIKSIFVICLLVFIGVLMVACKTLEYEEDYDEKPWTDRETWENETPGIGF